LEDLFAIAEDQYITIDCKGAGSEVVFEVGKLIRKYKRESITIWGAENPKHH